MIHFTLPIEPVAWQRVKRGQFGQTYVPRKTKRFETEAGHLARKYRLGPLLDGCLRLTAKFYVRAPKRRTLPRPAVRPDLDNYLKALKDALSGVIWTDDSRIVEYGTGTGKFYDLTGGVPRIEVTVEEITE